tara:strand:- start:1663 stop:2457 length:795 start_codon:yes stop_codon:yes gene_type:complete
MQLLIIVFCLFTLCSLVAGTVLWIARYLQIAQRWERYSERLYQKIPARAQVILRRWFDLEQKATRFHYRVINVSCLIAMLGTFSLLFKLYWLAMMLVLVTALIVQRGQRQFRSKQAHIYRELPDFCDLLAMMLASGLPLIPALDRVATASSMGFLAREINCVGQQIRRGTDLESALNSLADLYRVNALSEWCKLLNRGYQQGNSLIDALMFFSEQLRDEQLNHAEKKAQEAPVKLLLPLLSCFFPVNFLVILGPIFIQLSQGGY